MKNKSTKFLALLCALLVGSVAFAQHDCNISGPSSVCPTTGAFEYNAGAYSGMDASWYLDPLDGNLTPDPNNPDRAFIVFTNPTSDCYHDVPIRFSYYNNSQGGWKYCIENVRVYRDEGALSPISGNTSVVPIFGYVNSLPVETYSVGNRSCGSFTWTTPAGWDIISGQGTNSIQVQPTISSACSGQITVAWSNGVCDQFRSLTVNRAPLSNGSLKSYCDAVDSWTTLNVCPDDEIILDGSSSTFCGANDNIFISVTPCFANWTPKSPELTTWLSKPQYDALGGLSLLDMKKWISTYHSPNQFAAGNYKIKMAVGGGSIWNERTYQVIVGTGMQAPPGAQHVIMPKVAPATSGMKDVDLVWTGIASKLYEIVYEVADAPTFPKPPTVPQCIPCTYPTLFGSPGSGYVYTSIQIPECYHLRYKVRECACGQWYPGPTPADEGWVKSSGPLCKTSGKPTGIDELSTDAGITLYPNPASTMVTLMFNQVPDNAFTIEVYNISGKKVASRFVGKLSMNKYDMEIDMLKQGMYYLKVVSADEQVHYQSKFVKE